MFKYLVGALVGITLVFAWSCASWKAYDPQSNELSKESEWTWFWNVGKKQAALIDALEKNGKIKVIKVKDENPVKEWSLGGMMALGAIAILVGIGMIWSTKGVKLIQGLLMIGGGLSTFLVGYLLDEYLVYFCIVFGLVVAGILVYVFAVKKGFIESLIKGFEVQKGHEWSPDIENAVKAAQGGAQTAISAMRKKILNK